MGLAPPWDPTSPADGGAAIQGVSVIFSLSHVADPPVQGPMGVHPHIGPVGVNPILLLKMMINNVKVFQSI